MVMDALRGYLQLASGLTEVTREKARQAAKAMVAQAVHLGERPADARSQVRALADELATTARANRDHLVAIVRVETERAVTAIGVASADDVAALRRRVEALDRRLTDLAGPGSGASATTVEPTKKAAPTEKVATSKVVTSKATTSKATTKKVSPGQSAPSAQPRQAATKAALARTSQVATRRSSGSTAGKAATARTAKRAPATPVTGQ